MAIPCIKREIQNLEKTFVELNAQREVKNMDKLSNQIFIDKVEVIPFILKEKQQIKRYSSTNHQKEVKLSRKSIY